MIPNRAVADLFEAVADSMEVLGQDRFRILAYRRAAAALAELPMPLADYYSQGRLQEIPGVGKIIADKIVTILDTGTLPLYEELKEQVPPSVLEMLKVPDIGPRTAYRLHTEAKISSVEALKKAAEAGELRKLKGFGAKTEARILEGIEALARREQRMIMPYALGIAETLLESLRAAAPSIVEASYAGSLRRARPTTGDIDLLAAADDPAAVIKAFLGLREIAQVISSGDEKASVMIHSGQQVDLLVVPPAQWGSALQHFTGSKAHNIRFREQVVARGMSFSEHGFLLPDGTLEPCRTEAEVYAKLGLPYIPPELREDSGEFDAAREGRLPDLITQDAIRADLHMHSTWSDGDASIREMAEAARARGYSHIAITDHSAYLGVTGGVTPERLRQQAAEIAELNAEYSKAGIDFRILHGVEVDITPDGTLALPDDALAQLDWVVASLHVSLRQERAEITERLLKAIANPHVDLIGHPTGRILERREGADLDMEAIIKAAVEHNTALEINCGPDRLDLDPVYARRALELGATLAIDSDAHHPSNLEWMRYGVLMARRSWAESDRVLNTWSLDRLLEWIKQKG